jgi:basic amino acid/polyamine antiporter, APA family
MDKFRFSAGTAVIIANMVGTGVFTSLGLQLQVLDSGFVLLMLWVAGGLAALCGALSYAELGAALPRSGGEYNFLARIYHPGAGFVSGWVSATIGFAAPTALAAITFGKYLSASLVDTPAPWMAPLLASALLVIVTMMHIRNRRDSALAQTFFTLIKIAVIVVFCVAALALKGSWESLPLTPQAGDAKLLTSGAFAVSLIYVSYAYTGWNAATYLSSEMDNPQRILPKILVVGTAIVMLLYVALNFTFLKVAPVEDMVGKIEIGYIAAKAAFGPLGAQFTGLILAILLISTVSAMTLAGPRVLQVIGQDFSAFKALGATNKSGIPARAIIFQSALALIFVLTSSFDKILVFAGFTLGLNSFITVLGLFVLRWRQPKLVRPFKVPLFPIVPLIYLGLTGWTLLYVLKKRPEEALMGLSVIGFGLAFYFVTKKWQDSKSS